MTPEQFNQMVLAMSEALNQTVGARIEKAIEAVTARNETNSHGKVIGKHFKPCDFSGAALKWDEWSFAFKRFIRGVHKETHDKMAEVERNAVDIDETTELPQELEERSAELYDMLSNCCTGEAQMIVRQVRDGQGIHAWQRLHKRYSPRTMARELRLWHQAVNPPRAKDLNEVETAIAKWEEKVKALALQFSQELPERLKMAVLTSLVPGSVQDYVYTFVDETTKYEELREKVRLLVSNKIAVNTGPKPMEVDQIKYDDDYHQEEDINAVGEKAESVGHVVAPTTLPGSVRKERAKAGKLVPCLGRPKDKAVLVIVVASSGIGRANALMARVLTATMGRASTITSGMTSCTGSRRRYLHGREAAKGHGAESLARRARAKV